MATLVLIAHTGQRLQVDTTHFNSYVAPKLRLALHQSISHAKHGGCRRRLDDFKAWVSRQTAIPAQSIVALTPQGKTAKLQNIQTEVGIPL